MLHRISRAIEAGRKAASAAQTKGPAAAASAMETRAAWALLHFGDPSGLDDALAAHAAFCRSGGYRCLVVSDRIPPACFGAGEVVFEFAPWPLQTTEAHPGGFAAAVDYTFRRLGLIFDFWPVVGCTWNGPGSAELLELAPREVHSLVRIALLAPPPGRQSIYGSASLR